MQFARSKRFAHAVFISGALVACAGVAGAGYANTQLTKDEILAPCTVTATQSGGMLALEPVVEPGIKGQGSYRLVVESASGGGRSSVNQGGPFATDGKQATVLGTITIPANAAYTTNLEVEMNGKVLHCK